MKLIKSLLLTTLMISSNAIAESCAPTYGQEREKFQIAIIDDWPEHVTCVYSDRTMYELKDKKYEPTKESYPRWEREGSRQYCQPEDRNPLTCAFQEIARK